jgi:hypothetical protein
MINSLQLEFFKMINQSLVNSVVINAEFDRKDHDLISATAIERGLESLDTIIDLRTRLN